LLTISSGLCRLVLIISPPRTIITGGPIQWGRVKRPIRWCDNTIRTIAQIRAPAMKRLFNY